MWITEKLFRQQYFKLNVFVLYNNRGAYEIVKKKNMKDTRRNLTYLLLNDMYNPLKILEREVFWNLGQ